MDTFAASARGVDVTLDVEAFVSACTAGLAAGDVAVFELSSRDGVDAALEDAAAFADSACAAALATANCIGVFAASTRGDGGNVALEDVDAFTTSGCRAGLVAACVGVFELSSRGDDGAIEAAAARAGSAGGSDAFAASTREAGGNVTLEGVDVLAASLCSAGLAVAGVAVFELSSRGGDDVAAEDAVARAVSAGAEALTGCCAGGIAFRGCVLSGLCSS